MRRENHIISGIPTAFFRVGEGTNKILVINGGPGFGHSYMAGISKLAEQGEVIFYDQPGCGETSADAEHLNFTFYTAHLIDVIKNTLQGCGHTVIAHSFGCLLFAAALEKEPALADVFQQVIFINPVPLERGEFDTASHYSVLKLPADLSKRVEQAFLTGGAEGADFEELMPYYFYDPSFAVHAPKLERRVYFSVMGTVGEFDFYSALDRINKLDVVQSTHDVMHHEFLKQLKAKAHNSNVLNDLGHFPFLEDENKTLQVLKMLMR